jgi:hypothetical protein
VAWLRGFWKSSSQVRRVNDTEVGDIRSGR